MSWTPTETIAVGELESGGYTEDGKSRRAFERRYMPFSAVGLLTFVAGFYFLMAKHDNHTGLLLVGLGFAILLAAIVYAAIGRPVSVISGNRMERFKRADAEPGVTEFVYVDKSSKTYFSRVVLTVKKQGFNAGNS